MRRCKRIRRAERRKNSAPPPPACARRFRRDLSVARAQEFPEGRGRRIPNFGFGKNEVKFGELPAFGISRKGRSEIFARDLQSSRSFAAEKRGTLRKDCQNVSMQRGKIEGGQGAALPAVRILRSRASAAGGNRTACSACTELPLLAALLPEAAPPHGAILPPVQAPPAVAQRIFPETREKMRGNPPFADCPPPLGFAFFSGARKPAGFPRRGAQVGEMRCRRFRSVRRRRSGCALSFLGIRIGASETGAGWGILRPIFREISAERGSDWENN